MSEQSSFKILVVDDRPENLLAMESLLAEPGLEIHQATSGNEALALMIEHDYAVVLLDVQMPDMDGFETAELMRNFGKTKFTPIIFITAISKERQFIDRGYEAGAVDYLFKPIEPNVLRSKVNVFLRLYRQKIQLEENQRELELIVNDLELATRELGRANKKILEQQAAMIEEERLQVLLQMAGATAHELNQPLTAIMTHIDVIQLGQDVPKQLSQDLTAIKEASLHIAEIIKKMKSNQQNLIQPSIDPANVFKIAEEISILSVEDTDADFNELQRVLKNQPNIEIMQATSIKEGLRLLESRDFDLVFLDHILPDGVSLDFIADMERKQLTNPVVVITGQGDEMVASRLIQAGVYDYVPKSRLSEEELSRVIFNTIQRARLKEEISNSHKRIAEMSIIDELTQLYNRRYFMEALERAVSESTRYHHDLILSMMDLDHFKAVNDTYGHVAGDMVLQTLGKMIKESFRQSDLACRYGGEEIAVILPNAKAQNAFIVCERLRQQFEEHVFSYNDDEFSVTLSIGIAPLDTVTPATAAGLINVADKALYRSKNNGRNQVTIYTP